MARDESFALVTGAFKVDPADPKKVAPDNKLSVIDLKAKPPAVIATLEAGSGAAGVSINSAGTLALVANRSEGTVSVFTIAGNKLTPSGKIQLGDKSGPSHVAFTPDGKAALVTRDGDHKISLLSVDGNKVEDSKKFMVGGIRPYRLQISSKGDVAVVAIRAAGRAIRTPSRSLISRQSRRVLPIPSVSGKRRRAWQCRGTVLTLPSQ